jgi:hypothetical protein
MIIATNAKFILNNSSEDHCLTICDKTTFIKFFNSGKIETSCDEEEAAQFLFESFLEIIL